MKTIKLTILTLVLIAGTVTSCKKEIQQGPAGADGKAGTTGADGTAGVDGTSANANVHSFTFNTTGPAWKLNSNSYAAKFTVESITTAVLSGGTVSVFWGDGTGYYWSGMPVCKTGFNYNFNVSLNTVEVVMTPVDTNASAINPGAQQFKIVVIEN